ncbi:MAG: DUF6089 family protein [Ferruginibacter sp.]
MRKSFILLVFCLSAKIAYPQKFFTTFFGGISNYSGDLSGSNYFLRHSHPAWGLGLMSELSDRVFIRADFVSAKISGDDKWGTVNRQRNLSFKSDIAEFSLAAEYTLFNLYEYKVSPYFFAGVAAFQFKPTTTDVNGNYIILPDYSTEGQGFYEGRKPYKLRQVSFPLGGGVLWGITNNKRIGFVFGVRKTFTDYLDDVSTTYADQTVLAQNRGFGAVAIAWRGDDYNGVPYPAAGTKRGNPENNDWYFFSGATIRVRIQPKGSERRDAVKKPRKARYGCPVVW